MNDATNERPRGYTLADEERAAIDRKVEEGNVLDPIALDDPVGQSVERVIMRIGVTVVLVIIVGILLAQVACKNIQTMGIPDFAQGVSTSSIEQALKNGVMWGGDIVRFPTAEAATYDAVDDAVTVYVTSKSSRTFEQFVADSQVQACAMAMNVFLDPSVASVTFVARAPVSGDTGAFSTSEDDATEDLLRITWVRDPEDPGTYSCTMTGYDPGASLSEAEEGDA